MLRLVSKSLWLLGLTVVICCGVYPGVLWLVGQSLFPFQANGSLLRAPDGTVVGSRLIAQPFTNDAYFQPRPSAASYDGSASASSALAPSNYALRDRVARMLGPIVKYADGAKAGRLVAPDLEQWFRRDTFQGQPHLVAQWADAHNGLAQAWVTGDSTHAAYVAVWAAANRPIVAQWVKDNPATPQPKPADLAVVFFEHFSSDHPGAFPSTVTSTISGRAVSRVEPIDRGADVQATFFDMWRADHPDVALQEVPGDLVTTSASGLDPDISMENAKYQLDRVADAWAARLKRDRAGVRIEIGSMLEANASAPLAGLAGDSMVDVLAVNLSLRQHFGSPQ